MLLASYDRDQVEHRGSLKKYCLLLIVRDLEGDMEEFERFRSKWLKNRWSESWVNGIYLSGDMQRSEEFLRRWMIWKIDVQNSRSEIWIRRDFWADV